MKKISFDFEINRTRNFFKQDSFFYFIFSFKMDWIYIFQYPCSLVPPHIAAVQINFGQLLGSTVKPHFTVKFSRLVTSHVFSYEIDHVLFENYFWIVMYLYSNKVEYLNPRNVLLDRFIFCFHNEDTLRFTYHPLNGPFIPILRFYDVNSSLVS